MARPPAYLIDGEKVPGCTTVLNRFKDSGGLIHWACVQGQKHPELPVRDALYLKDEAADVGTIAHDIFRVWIQTGRITTRAQILRRHRVKPKQATQIYTAFEAGMRWFDGQKGEIIDAEVPLVSRMYRCGGTRDYLWRIGRRRRIFDVKTGAGVYVDALMQVAFYGQLERECNGNKVWGYDVVRFGKDDADFVHRSYENLDDALEMFIHLRECYEIDKRLRKRL